MIEFQRLTVLHYGETTQEDRRITLSPMNIVLVAAEVDDVVVNGRSVRKVTVLFLDQSSVDVVVNHADLELMEAAIGSFCLS